MFVTEELALLQDSIFLPLWPLSLLGLLNFHLKQASGWQRVCRITYEKVFRVGSPVDRPTGEDVHTSGVLSSSLSNT